jgi:hypothetical protein
MRDLGSHSASRGYLTRIPVQSEIFKSLFVLPLAVIVSSPPPSPRDAIRNFATGKTRRNRRSIDPPARAVSSASGLPGVNAPRVDYFSGNPGSERARERERESSVALARMAHAKFKETSNDEALSFVRRRESRRRTRPARLDARDGTTRTSCISIRHWRRRNATAADQRARSSLSTAAAATAAAATAVGVARYASLYRLRPNSLSNATLVWLYQHLSHVRTLSPTHLHAMHRLYSRAAGAGG